MNSEILFAILFVIALAVILVIAGLSLGPDDVAGAKCGTMKWSGEGHDDNKPSTKKGEELIKNGADVCTVAKKCDHMEIDVKIDNKKELHETEMYQNAPAKIQKELDEYADHGHGHDNPNLVCYEVEESIK